MLTSSVSFMLSDEDLRIEAELLDSMAQMEQLIARTQAELAQTMVAFVERRQGKPLLAEFAADEIAAALSWSRVRVVQRLRLVQQVRNQLPRTWAAWCAGSLDELKVAKIADAVDRLADRTKVADFDHAVAAAAPDRTWSELQSWLNRRVALAGPKEAEARHQRAFANRRVETSSTLDGMGWLWATTDALDLTAVDHRLTSLAHDLGADDPRTRDQRRADVLVDLLLGRSTDPRSLQEPAAREPAVAVGVTVPVQSLVGADDTPAMLDDGAAVPASVVREIAAKPGTLFYRLLTDERGMLLDVAQLGRFPSKLLGFAVDARDQTCRWPGCRHRATGCDCDHTIAHPDGQTTYVNLGSLCRRHHRCKHTPGYQLAQPAPGVFTWTMPTGHRYTTGPDHCRSGAGPTKTSTHPTNPATPTHPTGRRPRAADLRRRPRRPCAARRRPLNPQPGGDRRLDSRPIGGEAA